MDTLHKGNNDDDDDDDYDNNNNNNNSRIRTSSNHFCAETNCKKKSVTFDRLTLVPTDAAMYDSCIRKGGSNSADIECN